MSIDGNAPITDLVQWELKQLIKDAITELNKDRSSSFSAPAGAVRDGTGQVVTVSPKQGIDFWTARDLAQFPYGTRPVKVPDAELTVLLKHVPDTIFYRQ
jgi:hypothetical protein